MIFKLSEIHGDEVHHQIEDDGCFTRDELNLLSPVKGMVSLFRVNESEVSVTGSFNVEVESGCDRCGQPAQTLLSSNFTYDCIVGKEDPHIHQDVECGEEDVNKLYLEEPIINVGELFREQILLAMPMHILCSHSCKGLCQHCGIDLNSGTCTCRDKEVSSPFSVLKKLEGR
jgi:uncharacterized protein